MTVKKIIYNLRDADDCEIGQMEVELDESDCPEEVIESCMEINNRFIDKYAEEE